MTRTQVILCIAFAAVGAIALTPATLRYSRAAARSEATTAGLQRAVALKQELQTLRAAAPLWMSRSRPTADVAGLLQAVVRECRLPESLLAEVTPQDAVVAPRGTSGVRWAEQAVAVRLSPLPLADLGTFLDRWRDSHPEWIIATIDLQAQERGSDSTGGMNYSVSLRLTTSFVE